MTRPRGEELLDALERGDVRVAEPSDSGEWRVHAWVHEGILEVLSGSPVVRMEVGAGADAWPFVDKRAFVPRRFDAEDGVRLVPGGSCVRRGAHVGARTVLMPPCYVNVGAWVGEGAMIDSHALVGSGAQIGERVHVAAGTQVGGVLEPVGAHPVVIEDGAWIGGQCGLYEGVLVRAGAVLGAGVTLTASTPVFDLVHDTELRAEAGRPLEIPANAVVVPGTRSARGAWAIERGLAVACALIVKYRDASTDVAVALNDALR